jgi:RNA polymerase sigma-70 factor (ECF subfamily)
MDEARNQDLSQIGTIWTEVISAHQGSGEAVTRAQRLLMERYSGAVYRYLMGAVRNRDAADELFQEFALRFISGAFRNANPERGRFRDFVKTALYHLIIDHHKKGRSGPQALPVEEMGAEPAVKESVDFDAEFLHSWRQEVLCRTWEALERASRDGPPLYRVLRLRSERPDASSKQLAEVLTTELGRPINDAWVRQNVHRARERFAELLLDELAGSLPETTRERLEQELIDLNLLEYCKEALKNWKPG